ncbi:hypothetical protein K7X08_011238 [Anisodus acutangulus]|uniref:Uncharacterized protein n=1 Tax=Anisodus acutangulus TaxID=402998 RepID=A0A9Q1RAA3_9SOLA|nr:hypothetical protein K7X08_011238 [Anisodus acutangulus]
MILLDLTIHKLFSTRADLHRTVYMHPKVKAIELMVVDALIKANDHLQIASYINEPAQYWMLDDTIIKRIETSTHQDLEESRNLIRRIRRRDIYQNSDAHSNEEDVIVTNVKINLTSGRNNPLDRIMIAKPELVKAASEAFENFQMKTYGKKTQVHATPEKKKRLSYY